MMTMTVLLDHHRDYFLGNLIKIIKYIKIENNKKDNNMSEFASPGVISTERDFSATIQMLGTATGGTVVNSKWGFVDYEMVASNEDEFLSQAGKPTDKNFRDWFVAANFLKYTSALRWVRVVDEETAKNSTIGGSSPGLLIKNENDIDVIRSGGAIAQKFAAKCAGDLGDTLGISIADSATFKDWAYKDLFDTPPNSSGALGGSSELALDEVHVVVVDRLGMFSGVPNSVLETYAYLSKARDAKDVNGASSYYINRLNSNSEYVWALSPIGEADVVEDTASAFSPIGAKLSDGKPFVALSAAYTKAFTGGADGGVPGKNEYINAFDTLTSADDTDISLLFAGGCGDDLNHPDVSSYVLQTTSRRGDMLGFVSPKFSDVVGALKTAVVKNIIDTKEAFTTKDSFGVMTTGYKLQYDKYNDQNRWVPGNGDDAGLCARTENQNDVWESPAGFNRGHYVDCIALAFNPNQNARDELYKMNINPVVTFPKDGTILYGDKTMQAKNSAFSWIGIRRLFIYLRKSIRVSAKYNLFDFNTSYTRQGFKDTVEPILREILSRNGIFDFFVRCDETNNTPAVIQKGEFLADIIIKPQYSIQGIRLSFTAVRREVTFDEVVVA